MNEARRKRLKAILDQVAAIVPAIEEGMGALLTLKSDIEAIRDEEQEAYDNMPESLQNGERGQQSYAAINAMEEAESAIEGLEQVDQHLTDLRSNLETATD